MGTISIEELERRLDEGDDLDEYTDWEHPTITRNEKTRTIFSLPEWLICALDNESARRGISRSALVNNILVDWVDAQKARRQVRNEPPAA